MDQVSLWTCHTTTQRPRRYNPKLADIRYSKLRIETTVDRMGGQLSTLRCLVGYTYPANADIGLEHGQPRGLGDAHDDEEAFVEACAGSSQVVVNDADVSSMSATRTSAN